MQALDPDTRIEDLAVLAGVGLVGLGLWWSAVRALRLAPEKLTIHTPAAAA